MTGGGNANTMKPITVALCLAAACWSSCASEPPGPVVPIPPSVDVVFFNSTHITPDVIEFVGKVAIRNQMRGGLEIQQVDWGANLHDAGLFDDTFGGVRPMGAHTTTTVTLPFQIAMKDVAAQIVDVLAEESVRVTLRGTVVPVGFDPIPFTATKVIPIPRPPAVAIDGVRGNPLDGAFTVLLSVQNPNAFPLDFASIDSFVNLNGKRYQLLRNESFACLQPGGFGRIALTMQQTRGKALSMLVNVAQHGSAEFTIGGRIACNTPHGLFDLPLQLSSQPATPAR